MSPAAERAKHEISPQIPSKFVAQTGWCRCGFVLLLKGRLLDMRAWRWLKPCLKDIRVCDLAFVLRMDDNFSLHACRSSSVIFYFLQGKFGRNLRDFFGPTKEKSKQIVSNFITQTTSLCRRATLRQNVTPQTVTWKCPATFTQLSL